MKTPIVYTLVSSEEDIYLEQLYVSIYSLRLYNPNAIVLVLVDKKTFDSLIGYRSIIKEFADKILIIETPTHYTAKERSREIKTSIRKHIKGDFLFLDTDTIITDKLDDVDNIKADIAIVEDFHVPFSEYPFRKYIINTMKYIFDIDVSNTIDYFNSGAMYVKDTEVTHQFFNAWNKNWRYSAFKKNNSQDQPALMKTNYDFKNIIQKLDGVYNCQIAASIKYLYKAKVIHFFNANFFGKTEYSPFFTKEFYLNIRQNKGLSEIDKYIIQNCKESFSPYSTPIGEKEFKFLNSSFGKRLLKIYTTKGILYKTINLLLKILNKIG
jgi:hypothetical protein